MSPIDVRGPAADPEPEGPIVPARSTLDSTLRAYAGFAAGLTSEKPAGFILGADRGHGLAMTRSLGRRAIPVVALGRGGSPGMKSRFGLSVPIGGLDDAALVSRLLWLGERLPTRGVLLPTDDAYVLLLSRNAAALAERYRFSVADPDTLEALADKRQQYQFAARHGIRVPRTIVPSGCDEVAELARDLDYPVVIKPAFSHAWLQHRETAPLRAPLKLARAENARELIDLYAVMNAGDPGGVVIQEEVPGATDRLYAIYAYCSTAGRALALFVRQKLRDWPPGHGNGCYSTSTSDPEVENLGRDFMSRIGYRGLANIEFKRDPRDGLLKLIEFNVRSASQLALAVSSGVDIPFIAYSDLVGLDPGPLPAPREGVRWIDLGQDFLCFRDLRRRGDLSFGRWVRDVLRARSHAYFARDDLRPTLSRVGELVRGYRPAAPTRDTRSHG